MSGKRLNQETVVKALMSLGLSKTDVQTYIFLAKTGPKRSEEMAKVLKIGLRQVCRRLKNLQDKEIVYTVAEPAWFIAMPFGKIIDIIAKARKLEAIDIQRNRQELLSIWESLVLDDHDRHAR